MIIFIKSHQLWLFELSLGMNEQENVCAGISFHADIRTKSHAVFTTHTGCEY